MRGKKLAARAEQKQHRYLQALVKKMAEGRGYKAETELPTPDNKGKVDIALTKDGRRTAVEICVSTTAIGELHNIRKCVDAGYDDIIWCYSLDSVIQAVRSQLLRTFTESERAEST
jgi:hypothetical protein